MEGKVTISKWSSAQEIQMSIAIEDAASGLLITKINMTLENFADAITGLGLAPCELERIPTEYTVKNIGKKIETKTVTLDWKKYGGTQQDFKDLLQPYLIDGWELRSDGTMTQQHGKGHNVILCRFVKGD